MSPGAALWQSYLKLQGMLGVELAAMEQQGRGSGPMFAAFDFAHKDDMVAFFIAAAIETFKGRSGTLQDGSASRA